MKLKVFHSFLILNCSFLVFNCSDNSIKPPPYVEQTRDTITVSIEQVTHRSISVGLSKTLNEKSSYVLNRLSGPDTFAFAPFALAQSDTLIIDDNEGEGLTLDSDYSYFAYSLDSTGAPKDTGNTITAKTLAATSHDFTWTEYTLGSGELKDVWGTDENNVYAVGSVTTDSGYISLWHWDGTEWKPATSKVGGSSVFGFSENDIWVAGGGVGHFDGNDWDWVDHYSSNSQSFPLDQVLFDNDPYRAIWGTSSSNLYLGNDHGKIIHWDGEKGNLEDIQATQFIQDIWGFAENDIYACAGTVSGYREGQLFHWDGKNWTLIVEGGLDGELLGAFWGVWGFEPNLLYMSGDRIHTFTNNNWSSLRLYFFSDKIRGQQSNDIIAAGQFGGVAHYNGVEWHRFTELPVARETNIYKSAWFANDHVFLVGRSRNNGGAIIIHGIKN